MTTLTLLFAARCWAQGLPAPAAAATAAQRFLSLDVTVNGERTGMWPFVERGGVLHAPLEALDAWRVRVRPDVDPVAYRGAEYWPLAGVPGFTVKVDPATQSAEIVFSPEAFAATKLSRELVRVPEPGPVLPSVSANYDLFLGTSRGRPAPGFTDVGALVELAASGEWGVLTSSHALRNLARDPAVAVRTGGLRLETTFTRQFPASRYTLRLGDATTRPGLWGRSAHFAGLQSGTDYALAPGFVTQPLPMLTGVSAAPSTVQLYVNDVLRQVTQVPAGPFVIENTGALAGGGDARLVVKDILGREMVVVQPFFTSPQLLARGLADWGVEAGALRNALGSRSASYGPGFASGTLRRGLSDGLTLEARGEAMPGLAVAGAGAIVALPGDVLGRAAAVESRAAASSGRQWLLGLERQWIRSSVYFQALASSRGFRQLGLATGGLPPRWQAALTLSHRVGAFGEIGLHVAGLENFAEPPVRTFAASYSVQLAGGASVNLRLARVSGAASGVSANATLLLPIEPQLAVTGSVTSHAGSTDAYATAARTSAEAGALNWRVLAGHVQREWRSEAGLYYNGERARAYADLAATQGQQALRAGVTGGLVAAGGHLFATPRIDAGFALAELKGLEGVAVGVNSSTVAHTDARGLALLPNLAPWQANQVKLAAADLPPAADIAVIEKVAVPRWRSGVKLDFPVRTGRSALVSIDLDDGSPAPAGATVQVEGDPAEFYVGRAGQAYVTGARPRERLRLAWKGNSCEMQVDIPEPVGERVPRVGPITCAGVAR